MAYSTVRPVGQVNESVRVPPPCTRLRISSHNMLYVPPHHPIHLHTSRDSAQALNPLPSRERKGCFAGDRVVQRSPFACMTVRVTADVSMAGACL